MKPGAEKFWGYWKNYPALLALAFEHRADVVGHCQVGSLKEAGNANLA